MSSPSSAPASFRARRIISHLTILGVHSLIVCGESTSGCVRASVVDAYSNGYHVASWRNAPIDRAELTHKVNLFDMHHKYADVMHLDEVAGASGFAEPAACRGVGEQWTPCVFRSLPARCAIRG